MALRLGLEDPQSMHALREFPLSLLPTFLVPLIIWLMKKEESSFIDHHGKEALNFQITMMIGHVVGGALICVTLGVVNMAVWVLTLVFCIIAGMAANRGEKYTYPLTIRFIS